jgi:hypothetical protein
MSTSTQNVAPLLMPPSAPCSAPPLDAPLVEAKKRIRPYKPRMSTVVKNGLEDSMKEVRRAEEILEKMLGWLSAERERREELRSRICRLSPIDHRMQELLQEERESLISIGRLDHMVAEMSQCMLHLERNLNDSLDRSKEAVAPPRERKEDRRQQ